jgi:hypothetical protein
MKIFPFCKTTTLKNDIINMINVEERRNFDSEKERNEIFKEIIIIKRDVVKFKEKVKLCEKNKESLI